MASVDKDFSYSYVIEGSSSLEKRGFRQTLLEKLRNLSDLSSEPKIEDGKIKFVRKYNRNLIFEASLEVKKFGDSIKVTGNIHRRITGWGGCLICGTLGLASFMITKNMERIKPDELKDSIDNIIENLELEIKEKGEIGKEEEKSSSSIEILKERYAKGELSEEEFERMKDKLQE